jgi:membrane-bound lytic murein transglycosylase D
MPATLKVYSRAHRKKLGDLNFSTKIAILILKENYEQLGSWPLAINAYHSGLGRIKKAKEELNTSDICKITSEFKGRAYKFASRNYYAQFLAAKRIVDRRALKDRDPK